MAAQLGRRFQKVLKKWPVDSSRQGRDLGEYLHKNYNLTFKKILEKDVKEAERSLRSLENLSNNYYLTKYARKHNYGFSGDLLEQNQSILSNAQMEEMKSASLPKWQRLKAWIGLGKK